MSTSTPGSEGTKKTADGSRARQKPVEYTLDQLAASSFDELTRIFRAGTVPTSLRALDGNPKCRMLTWVGPVGRGIPATTIRLIGASPKFPWGGKAFTAIGDYEGRGLNRIHLFGEHQWLPFATRIAPSALDGEPCIWLDYDNPSNLWAIRHIRDELREVCPGLFMGPAMIQTGTSAHTFCFFACDNRHS